jgi:hypothetical protein
MLLPSAEIRASLRLQNPAQKLIWAAEQLFGGSYPSPAVIANPILGIPAKPALKGMNPEYLVSLRHFQLSRFNAGQLYCQIHLPVDTAQYYRGVPLNRCLRNLVEGAVLPYVGVTPEVPAIADSSTARTVEEYLYEQAQELRALNPAMQCNFAYREWQETNQTPYKGFACVITQITVLENAAYTGLDRYGKYSPKLT